jgi:hypothetical protein
MGGNYLDILARQKTLKIVEKANIAEAALNFVIESVTTFVSADFPNKYKVLGQNNEDLFYAVEKTSMLESSLGWNYAVDLAFTQGGQSHPVWKLRGDSLGATAADFTSGMVALSMWEDSDSWCCPAKMCAATCWCCHESIISCPCGVCGTCIEGVLQSICCCFSEYMYFAAPISGVQQISKDIENRSGPMDNTERKPHFAFVRNKLFTCPCICVGMCGEGQTFTILQDPVRDETMKPLKVYLGKQIGSLKRRGRGLVQTWCCPAFDADTWTLDMSGTKSSHDKLKLLATVLFMDHANIDQLNDA